MSHERVNIEHWKTTFPLAEARAQGDRFSGGATILGPRSLALFEQVREEYEEVFNGVEQVPTDIFIWARGEGSQRAVTKIGGLPYRHAGHPWPMTPNGTPLTFVGQINFVDSRDLFSALPGDILLIFAEDKPFHHRRLIAKDEYREITFHGFQWGLDASENSVVMFEWVHVDDIPLITADAIPQTGWQLHSYSAQIYRTWDAPGVYPWDYPHMGDYIPTIVGATKIGGAPAWVQEPDAPDGAFLCAIDSFCHDVYQPYAFLNTPAAQPKPSLAELRDPAFVREYLAEGAQDQPQDLLWGDCGTFYLFINSDGDLRWTAQAH